MDRSLAFLASSGRLRKSSPPWNIRSKAQYRSRASWRSAREGWHAHRNYRNAFNPCSLPLPRDRLTTPHGCSRTNLMVSVLAENFHLMLRLWLNLDLKRHCSIKTNPELSSLLLGPLGHGDYGFRH